ncbi:unnamed protein product [Blepharisma stoltei]|uniref:Uncharacterized protein n=1 Tax=Blepharisma stoltei TaxID=1481888 RepID=A0AAU9II74_9CILI|nr:unnamed protein product [Blepharisma stoltei]
MSDERLDKQAKIEIRERAKRDIAEEDRKVRKQLKKEYWKEVRYVTYLKSKEYGLYAAGISVAMVPLLRSVAIFPIAMTGYVGVQAINAWWSVPKPPGV